MNKKGVTLMALALTIVLIFIIASVVVLNIKNDGILDYSKEAKFKNDLKAFDQEIKNKISIEYLEDRSVMTKTFTTPGELRKYSPELADSEYVSYCYISQGALVLKSSMLTEDQKKWAREANILLDTDL